MVDEKPDFSKLNVLVVEDDRTAMNLAVSILRDLGFREVYTAQHGAEGYEVLSLLHVDLVVCDLKMPVMNGLELLRQVRLTDNNLQFIMLTGQADVTSVTEARKYGVTAYIKKPFNAAELHKKVAIASRIIALKRQQRFSASAR